MVFSSREVLVSWTPLLTAEVRRQLQRLTAALLAQGWSTKKLLVQILGLYASIFIIRRGFFSLYHQGHIFCSNQPYGRWFAIAAPLLGEFRAASTHLFLLLDLRAGPSTRLLATDATPTSGDAAASVGFEALTATLYLVAESR